MLCLLTYKPSPCSIHILSVAPPLVYKGTPPLSAPDQCEVSISLSLSLSLSHIHFPDTLNSVFPARTALLASDRERFRVSLTCERERYIPPSVQHILLFPPKYWHWWRRRRCCRRRRSSSYGSKLPASYCWIYIVDHSSHVWAPRRCSTTTPPQ